MKVLFPLATTVACCLLATISQATASRRGGMSSIAFRPAVHRSPVSSSTQRRAVLDPDTIDQVQQCAAGGLGKTLARGAFLRVASDLSGGTPLETIKCRVTATTDGPIAAFRSIVAEGGYGNLWTGSSSRSIEGALLGALFLIGSTAAKKQTLAMGGSATMAALSGGLVGGLAQAIVMTPAGMVFTSLNLNRGKKGYENDTAMTVTKRILKEKGLSGMFYGGGPMAMRQATNWMSRSYFTEVARTTFRMSQYGIVGEIGSGVIGGLGSCWNTPIETIRVFMQADVSANRTPKTTTEYWRDIRAERGMAGLFRGVTPRGVQAIWQTVFMVVVPNMLGV